MVVGGLPEPVPDHAERVAEFSIGMVASAAKVMSPVDGTPLKVWNPPITRRDLRTS